MKYVKFTDVQIKISLARTMCERGFVQLVISQLENLLVMT